MIHEQTPYTFDRVVRLALGRGCWRRWCGCGLSFRCIGALCGGRCWRVSHASLVLRLERMSAPTPACSRALVLTALGSAGVMPWREVGAGCATWARCSPMVVQNSELAARAASAARRRVADPARTGRRPGVQALFGGVVRPGPGKAVADKVLPGSGAAARGAQAWRDLAGLVVVLFRGLL
jgi:hypothetical protein